MHLRQRQKCDSIMEENVVVSARYKLYFAVKEKMGVVANSSQK